MRHLVEILRMLGFVGILGLALAGMSLPGCERSDEILKIETPSETIDVEKRPDGVIEVDVEDT
jgi:hypothetical protein